MRKLFLISALLLVGISSAFCQTTVVRPNQILLNSTCRIRAGSGSPEGAVTGNVCDIYLRTNGGAGTVIYRKESGTGNTGWVADLVPDILYKKACVVDQGGVYSPEWESSGSDFPTLVFFAGTNNNLCVAAFPDPAIKYIYTHHLLRSDWGGTLTATFTWRTTATTGNMVWQVQTACIGVGDSIDPAWNTASTVTSAAQGTASRFNTATISSVIVTGCTAGKMMSIRVFRDPGHASDNLGSGTPTDAQLIGVQFKF